MHRQRAEDNGVYVVTAGVWPNNAVVINPHGEIIADGIMTGVAVATIDVDQKYPQKYLSVSSFACRNNMYLNELRDDLYI